MSVISRYETVSDVSNLNFAQKENMGAYCKRYYLIIIIIGFSISLLPAQTTLSPFIQKKLDSIATQDVPAKAPGIATAIIQNGKVLYEKYAGIADFTDSSWIGVNTRFNIASNGKQFTALAILSLIEEKKLYLTDDIRKYFPSLYPNIKTPITIEHILTHTSGIRDVYDLWSLQGLTWWKQSFNNQDVRKLLQKQQDLNFQPGTKYLYSNTNYILLALLIEKATGQTFRSFTESLFRTLGMHQTAFEDDHTKIKGPIARAYFNFNTWTTYSWIWDVCGDGNLFSTLKDQIRWEQIIQGTINTGIKRSIILKSQQLINPSLSKQYGYGLEFGEYRDTKYTFHEGATGAWKATTIRFPEQSLSMITLTNTGKSIPSQQTRQMADIILSKVEKNTSFISQPTKTGNYISEMEIVGTYLTPNNFSFQFEWDKNQLLLKRSGRNDIILEREAANIFHQKNDPAFKQEFEINEKGEMQVTAYYTTHAPYTLTRPTANWDGFNVMQWNGAYLNQETDIVLNLKWIANKTYELKIGETNTYKATLVTPSMLLAGPYILRMENDGSTTIYLDGERIRNVKFMLTKQ